MFTLRLVRRFSAIPSINRNKVLEKSKIVFFEDYSALVELRQEWRAKKLFNLFKENAGNVSVVEDRSVFENVVRKLAGAGRFDYIESLLEQQKSLPQGRREDFVIRIIGLYGQVGMIRHAVKAFSDMHLNGCRRTVESFNATLVVLAKSGDVNMIESFLRDAPTQYDIKIDTMSLNIVVDAFCKMHMLDKAYMFMVEADKFGVCPDMVTYTTLKSAFDQTPVWEVVNGLVNLLVSKGCSPDPATFNDRIQFLANSGRVLEANEVLALMHAAKITPDEITYKSVIKAFFLAGRPDMVSSVCSDFYRRGYKPNDIIYHTIIHYLCIAKDYDLAFTKCQESMKSNYFPSLPTIYMLLDGLWKNNRRDKAILIMSLVRRKAPPYTKDQLQAMQSLLSLQSLLSHKRV